MKQVKVITGFAPPADADDYELPPLFARARSILHHALSIWLFTYSDLKTVVLPSTAFAIFHRWGRSAFSVPSPFGHTAAEVLLEAPLAAGWVWINILPYTIDNQRQARVMQKDKMNKPWRPLPSGRITPIQATDLMQILYPVAIATSIALGAGLQSVTLTVLGVWHNNFGGSNCNWLIRNVVNGCGFVCFTSGALQVLQSHSVLSNSILIHWFSVIGAVVGSTAQIQDMYDQADDSSRGRKSAPLVLGDKMARWSIALPTTLWSWLCPWFWAVPLGGYVAPTILGLAVAVRALVNRTEEEDRANFRLWNLWLVSLYTLPLLAPKLATV